tara:strand:+ start:24385 stop:27453 length:3069 start_codon:yes stop_codon:yes gene_type:complete
MKKGNLLLLFVLLSAMSFAQNTLFLKAKSLFDNEKYSACQSILNQLLISDEPSAEIMYMNARCSKELFLTDAIFLYNDLNKTFPYHEYKDRVNNDLALIYYREKQYYNAISSFLKLKNISNEKLFKLAYAYYMIDSLENAQLYFSRIMNNDSKFASASQYYFSSIEYHKGLYQSALSGFKKLLDDKRFGQIVPYYISHIYFYQKEYHQLIVFAKPLSDNVDSSRRYEINRLLAEAYYQTGDYTNAINHFEIYIDQQEDVSSMDYFFMGYSYYKLEKYEKTITNLERVFNASDSVMQYSSYYLGASYLALEQYNYALQAFKKSATYSFNKKLQEEAYFTYAKLSYQLDLPFENTLNILNTYLENYNNPLHKEKISSLMAKIFQATSKYSEAYTLLNNIQQPNFEQQKALQQLAFFIGVKYFNNQNFKEAIVYFSNSNKYPINDTYVYLSNFWISDCYFYLGEYKKSIIGYSNLPNSRADNLSYYVDLKNYNIAYSYFQVGDYLNALKWFRYFEKLTSDSMKVNDTYLRIADSYFMNNDFVLSSKYYNKAIELDLFDTDYALYQNAVSLGLIGKDVSKAELLKKIVSDFNNSSYFDDALYDLAKYYKNRLNYDVAIKYFEDLISYTTDENMIADAYLSKGMIYFNSGKVDIAVNEFLYILNNYPQTIYFREALAALQSAYSSVGKIEEYLAIIESMPEINISQLAQDSLTYNTAFMKFSEMDYEVAKKSFNRYIQRFKNGIFINAATYYCAITQLETGDTLSAVLNYEKVVESGIPTFQEKALLFLARRSYNSGDYKKSNFYYTKLMGFISSNSIKREAIVRLMTGNEFDDKIVAANYAKRVIEFEKKDNWLLSRAYIIVARHEFDSGNYAKSKSIFKKVSKLSVYDEGAEAKYYLAYLTYLDEDFVLAEKLIFDLAEDYNNDYFIAKAFILLSDIYMYQNNIFQAKATLESIIENHEGEDLVNIARKKWEHILETEKEKIVEKINEEPIIEILEDDFQYDIIEIDEDYIVPIPDTAIVDEDNN